MIFRILSVYSMEKTFSVIEKKLLFSCVIWNLNILNIMTYCNILWHTETCNAVLNVKDTLGISTLSSIDQAGNISTSNSLSVNPTGSSNVFLADKFGNVTTSGNLIVNGTSTNINSSVINIGTVGNGNIITLGNSNETSSIYIYGSFYNPTGNSITMDSFINQFWVFPIDFSTYIIYKWHWHQINLEVVLFMEH